MNINKLILTIFLSPVIIVSLMSCSSSENNSNSEKVSENAPETVVISKEQFVSEKMKLGNSQMHSFKKIFKTNGILTAAPGSKADIHSYLPGTIKQIFVTPGNYISKGQVLLSIESKEFISLQMQYLEALVQQKALEAEYKRVKELYNENITSQKEYFSAESRYKTLNAKIQALKAELKIVQVNLNNLENGNISGYINIKSPIKGFVSNINCSAGQFIGRESMLMKVIDNSALQLHFFVYQENIGKIKEGQKINIYSAGNSGKTYSAVVTSIGKSIDKETKSILCIAEPEPALKDIFVDGMYFQVEVVTETTEAQALPTKAFIESGSGLYVLIKEKEDSENLYFKKVNMRTGTSDDTFTQIIVDNGLNNVLIEGTYYF